MQLTAVRQQHLWVLMFFEYPSKDAVGLRFQGAKKELIGGCRALRTLEKEAYEVELPKDRNPPPKPLVKNVLFLHTLPTAQPCTELLSYSMQFRHRDYSG